MSAVYQVLKDGEPLPGVNLYAHERKANEHAEGLNRIVIERTMKECNQLHGAIRGKNRSTLEVMINRVVKPPYTVVKRSVVDSWG